MKCRPWQITSSRWSLPKSWELEKLNKYFIGNINQRQLWSYSFKTNIPIGFVTWGVFGSRRAHSGAATKQISRTRSFVTTARLSDSFLPSTISWVNLSPLYSYGGPIRVNSCWLLRSIRRRLPFFRFVENNVCSVGSVERHFHRLRYYVQLIITHT